MQRAQKSPSPKLKSLTKKNALTKKERLPAKLKSALVHISLPALRKKEQIVIFTEGILGQKRIDQLWLQNHWSTTGAPLQNRKYPVGPSIKKKGLKEKRKGLTKKERLPAKLKSALVHISFPTLRKKNDLFFLLKDFGPFLSTTRAARVRLESRWTLDAVPMYTN
jgi:hypothetical protein